MCRSVRIQLYASYVPPMFQKKCVLNPHATDLSNSFGNIIKLTRDIIPDLIVTSSDTAGSKPSASAITVYLDLEAVMGVISYRPLSLEDATLSVPFIVIVTFSIMVFLSASVMLLGDYFERELQ